MELKEEFKKRPKEQEEEIKKVEDYIRSQNVGIERMVI